MSAEEMDVEELLRKAEEPAQDALKLHPFYKGKMETTLKCTVRGIDDFAIWYTPGVAAPCRDIHENPEKVYQHTSKGNTIAVVSDGTRVLGLGDIGVKAGLPVMEGKALLFKYLGGVDAVPIMLDTKDPEDIIDAVLLFQHTFGGINLEDISQPKCFKVLDELRERAVIPVWHDDQQGTATVTLAGLMNALKIVGKEKEEIGIAFIGAGSANVAVSRLIFNWGVDPGKCVMVDSTGILGPYRDDIEKQKEAYAEKWHLCQITNQEGRKGGIAEAMEGMDVIIGLSKPGPETIQPAWVESMNEEGIVFACANPIPEIWPWVAKEAGARIVSTGRSDFPNQVNNSLGFPGIFRGTLDVRATTITDEMCFAAAEALAEQIGDDLHEEQILPTMDDWEVFPREAAAVGMKAQEQGVARLEKSYDELFEHATKIIRRSRNLTEMMKREGFIDPPPED
jgi:malate dehydrogenase (oxaloacetate-decarboxylating)